MVNVDDYGIATGYVLSNNREIIEKDKVVYMPIYATLLI
jgi:hypothetical protein